MIVTETRLNNIANGYLDPDKLNEPFVILRTHQTFGREREGVWCYLFVWGNVIDENDDIVDSIELSSSTAKKLIRLYEMKVAHSEKGGQVYERPDMGFKKMYPRAEQKGRKRKYA